MYDYDPEVIALKTESSIHFRYDNPMANIDDHAVLIPTTTALCH
jgi:hypothetical protein